MRYPISIQTFEKIRTGGYVYVDKTDLLAMFYQAGYLPIKAYRVYTLDYPNVEVRSGFSTLLYNGYFKNKENEAPEAF